MTAFCTYNKIQVLVLNLSGDSGPTDGTVKEYHSKQPPMAPGRVLWMGQEKGWGHETLNKLGQLPSFAHSLKYVIQMPEKRQTPDVKVMQ